MEMALESEPTVETAQSSTHLNIDWSAIEPIPFSPSPSGTSQDPTSTIAIANSFDF